VHVMQQPATASPETSSVGAELEAQARRAEDSLTPPRRTVKPAESQPAPEASRPNPMLGAFVEAASLMASSTITAPVASGVQRRETGSSTGESDTTRRVSPDVGPAAVDTAKDRAWLQRHADALYPHIRDLIRAEMLRDRERRGRMLGEGY